MDQSASDIEASRREEREWFLAQIRKIEDRHGSPIGVLTELREAIEGRR